MDLAEDSAILERGGQRVTVRMARGGVGDALPILVLHGGGPGSSSWTDFSHVLPRLAALRRVILVDLVQCGRSGFLPIDGPMWSYHAEVLREVLDGLDVPTVDVVAQSMGSAAMLRFAADAPERVRRAVLTGAAPFGADRVAALGSNPALGGEVWQASYADGPPTPAVMASVLGRCEWFDESAIPVVLLEQRCLVSAQPHQQDMAADRTLRGQPEDLEPLLGDVEVDVTCIWGSDDPFVTPQMRAAVIDALPTARSIVIDRASHHPQSERPAAWSSAALPSLHL